jgi:chromosome segregation ATPase
MDNSLELKKKIDEFKGKMTLSNNYMVFEPNSFDIFIDKVFLKFNHRVNDLNNNKMIKKILNSSILVVKRTILSFWNSLKNITEKLNLIKLKFDQLEQKIENQQITINENLNTNKQIKEDLFLLHKSIEKLTNNIQSKTELPNISNLNNPNLENEKVKFYQEENLRIGGELLETKKKFDMVKSEIEKYEQQRSNLIAKINSVNEALENTNVVTNVFENEISKPKVSIIDHKNLEKNNDQKQDINEEIRKIFSK